MSSETSNNHVQAAVDILGIADALATDNNVVSVFDAVDIRSMQKNLIAMAQVHATLALATKDW